MTGDKNVQDAARIPGDDNAEPVRRGVRAVAKKVAKKVSSKVTKKPRQKRSTRKTSATSSKTTRKAAKAAPRTEASAASPASATALAEATGAASTTAQPASPGAAPSAAPAAAASSAGSVPPAPAASSIDAPRPPAPMHPGASMDAVQEHVGGIGGMLALWGPLIIVGFLVLIFRGGDEGDVAAGSDVASQPAGMQAHLPGTTGASAVASRFPEAAPGYAGTAPGASDGFDRTARSGGLAMRTSMAGTPAFPGSGAAATMPPAAPRIAYPPPSGPYRNPWSGGVPARESWSAAAGVGEGSWTDVGRSGVAFREGVDSQTQWVRCAPPYYWCPAPRSPAW